MENLFDFHFHLLFKHLITVTKNGGKFKLGENVKTTGLAQFLNDIFGGPFDSQSSPLQVSQSSLRLGVIALLSVEHAFANRVLHVFGADLSGVLPLDKDVFNRTRNGETTYYQEFKKQIDFHLTTAAELNKPPYQIEYLNRTTWANLNPDEVTAKLTVGDKRYFSFSIEGGHNLSDVPIRKTLPSRFPELKLKELQDRPDVDFISINLCHLSHIPEQPLGGFAQGLNKTSQLAFASEDFMPKTGLGLTELGKKVIKQALTHPTKPILIDVKHMSVYTRLHYYRYREQLAIIDPEVERLPIMTSHTGFTFYTLDDYLQNKRFQSTPGSEGGQPISKVAPENRSIGRTNDIINKGLFGNPWTINLFDEEIAEIMLSNGMMGISLDQRILGASNPAVDSKRDRFFEEEYIARPEWEKMFRDGKLPGATESLFGGIAPSKQERHSMLLCLHLVHAVRVGYSALNWIENTSPWDHLCVGSDFDGLINPINGFEDVLQLPKLRGQLLKYLPQADKFLPFNPDQKALRYKDDGSVDAAFLNEVIDKFLFKNGLRFTVRFLNNWQPVPVEVPF
jgi:microsomal dipeptidase-like Zn-dependent dipeptidase